MDSKMKSKMFETYMDGLLNNIKFHQFIDSGSRTLLAKRINIELSLVDILGLFELFKIEIALSHKYNANNTFSEV